MLWFVCWVVIVQCMQIVGDGVFVGSWILVWVLLWLMMIECGWILVSFVLDVMFVLSDMVCGGLLLMLMIVVLLWLSVRMLNRWMFWMGFLLSWLLKSVVVFLVWIGSCVVVVGSGVLWVDSVMIQQVVVVYKFVKRVRERIWIESVFMCVIVWMYVKFVLSESFW